AKPDVGTPHSWRHRGGLRPREQLDVVARRKGWGGVAPTRRGPRAAQRVSAGQRVAPAEKSAPRAVACTWADLKNGIGFACARGFLCYHQGMRILFLTVTAALAIPHRAQAATVQPVQAFFSALSHSDLDGALALTFGQARAQMRQIIDD